MEAPGCEEVLAACKEHLSAPVDEALPYQHLYACADLLQTEIDKQKRDTDGNHDDLQEKQAWLKAQKGLVLCETDLVHDGESCILDALPCLEAIALNGQSGAHHLPASSPAQGDRGSQKDAGAVDADQDHAPVMAASSAAPSQAVRASDKAYKAVTVIQRCYNALGALWSERSDMEAALKWLSKAERLYHEQRSHAQQHRAPPLQPALEPSSASAGASTAAGTAPTSSGACEPVDLGEVLEAGYTLTVFSLAQVHGHAGSKEQSALYCAATLQRQLASGEVQLSEWVQNCLQLSAYYVNASAFAIGQYLLEAVQRVSQMEAQRRAESSDAPAAGSSAEQGVAWQSVLDDDVAANVNLAWGKLYLYRLVASLTYMQQGDGSSSSSSSSSNLPYPTPKHFPDLLRFPSLSKQLPSPEELPWGVDALATSFKSARDLFNAAIPRYNAALEFYKLDGWVTEHVTTQLEVSNLYRILAAFETDPKRAAAMHKLRVARLEHLVGALNPQHYMGLSRSIDLETANAWRDHVDALTNKLDAKSANKSSKAIAAGATAATRSYTNFINSFRRDDTGELPDRIDQDNEHFFLMAAFNLGRVLHRCALRMDQSTNDSDVDIMVQAYKHLHWIAAYVKRHKIEKMKQEASMAEQLACLIAEKIDLSKRMACLPKNS